MIYPELREVIPPFQGFRLNDNPIEGLRPSLLLSALSGLLSWLTTCA